MRTRWIFNRIDRTLIKISCYSFPLGKAMPRFIMKSQFLSTVTIWNNRKSLGWPVRRTLSLSFDPIRHEISFIQLSIKPTSRNSFVVICLIFPKMAAWQSVGGTYATRKLFNVSVRGTFFTFYATHSWSIDTGWRTHRVSSTRITIDVGSFPFFSFTLIIY